MNLQQIPSRGDAKEIRRIFGAGPGNVLLSSDFSQQEPRILAHLSGDESMKDAYRTGKDLYSTMAAAAFKVSYEDCLEFYLDENGKKTDKTNKEGKLRRTRIKSVLLGILYGRGVASVAEMLDMSTEEAQKLMDDFFDAYPLIKVFMEDKQKEAKEKGYTETAWGRRRYLEHIQLDKYTYAYNDNRPVDFNPLFTAKTIQQAEVSQEIKDKYNDKLERANYYQKTKIIENAANEGIDITNNSGFIAEAIRQVVNSTIQGKPNRFNCPYTLNLITQGCVA